jgi:hypothetical protein
VFDSGGWVTWGEAARLAGGAKAVRLANGTRLTREARDRLWVMGVSIVEE